MSSLQVRPFRCDDHDQLTALISAHVQAVVPGVSVSVNTVLSQLERDPAEFIVDPWVVERATLVAEQRGRIAAAAHVLRYGTDEVGPSYRGAGEIRWLLCWPEAPYRPDPAAAGRRRGGGGRPPGELQRGPALRRRALPAPGVYGLPEHV